MGGLLTQKIYTREKSEQSTLYSSVVNVHIVIIMWHKYTRRWEEKIKQNSGGKRRRNAKCFSLKEERCYIIKIESQIWKGRI